MKAAVRCVYDPAPMIAGGWIEWRHAEDPKQPKQPFVHRLKTCDLFAFAGLWIVAQPTDAVENIASCAIVTTSANTDASVAHDRMPVVLDGVAAEDACLDREVDLDAALELVRPLPDGLLDVCPLSRKINFSRVEGIELLTPLHR